MDIDWNKARAEYLAGGTSYRQLAAKYEVSYKAIYKRANAEGWVALREQVATESAVKTAAVIADSRAEAAADVMQSAKNLLNAFDTSLAELTREGPLRPKGMKDMADALGAIQRVLDSRPTELDIAEQQAKIDKLRKEVSRDDDRVTAVRVTLEGALDEYV